MTASDVLELGGVARESTSISPTIAEQIERAADARPDHIAAIDDQGGVLSYAELIDRSDDLLAMIGARPRFMILEGSNTIGWLVAYVAALRGGHPVLIAPGGNQAAFSRLQAAFGPSLRIDSSNGFMPEFVNQGTVAFHRDLALMLSTSGSTGSAKCVRLSHANIAANAASIATYLEIGADERGVVSLPTHYSYGLSVVNSHLYAGATILLTGRSVIDPAYWDFCTAQGATSFAGVPHSYDLLSRSDFAGRAPATLRYFTQAGGRLSDDHARHFAQVAAERGWRFYIMYGQTEASARMAYLPPAQAPQKPGSIGIAIPGGQFSLIDPEGQPIEAAGQQGELVYEGANVMMGYAMSADDLALPPGPSRLLTGDLVIRDEDGFYYIKGRLSRFVKIFGNRIGLDDVEQRLADAGIAAIATGIDDQLLVVTRDADAAPRIAALIRDMLKLPDMYFSVLVVDDYPLLSSGKIDYAGLRAGLAPPAAQAPAAGTAGEDDVAAIFARTFGEAASDESESFQSLGGDSLNYVAIALGLDGVIGVLPDDWTTLSIGSLTALAEKNRAAGINRVPDSMPRNLETLRALACMLVVMYHVVGDDAGAGLRLPMDSLYHHFVNLFQDVRMPLFTAMAGFLYGAMPVAREGLGMFIWRKARLLLAPLVLVTLASWMMRMVAYRQSDDLIHAFTYGYLHLWYLYALMVIFVIVAALDNWVSTSWKFWLGVLLVAPLVHTFVPLPSHFAIRSAVGLLGFFSLGLLLKRRPQLLRSKAMIVGAVSLAALMLLGRILEMAGQIDAPSWVYFTAGLSTVYVFIRLFPRVPIIEPLGAFSFTIYLWHPIANAFARVTLRGIGVHHIPTLAVVGFGAAIAVPVAMHLVIVRGPRWLTLPTIGK